MSAATKLRSASLPTALGSSQAADFLEETLMARTYNVVDADGHILEPLDLWDKYMDPAFRDRAPRLIKAENGKERLVMDEDVVGPSQRGIGSIGGVGARQGVVATDTMEYKDGKPGGFDPHA